MDTDALVMLTSSFTEQQQPIKMLLAAPIECVYLAPLALSADPRAVMKR